MQLCIVVDIHRSGERTLSEPAKDATGGNANWSHEGRNRTWSKTNSFKQKLKYIAKNGHIPNWQTVDSHCAVKPFLRNTTPCQQHCAYSVHKLPSNHSFVSMYAQYCWWRVVFLEKALQHSGCQQFFSLFRGKSPLYWNVFQFQLDGFLFTLPSVVPLHPYAVVWS